jgi:hypothetical protein
VDDPSFFPKHVTAARLDNGLAAREARDSVVSGGESMPLDSAGREHAPSYNVLHTAIEDERLFCVRFTGEAFREYECVPPTERLQMLAFARSLAGLRTLSMSL